jgi:hypothetical protein
MISFVSKLLEASHGDLDGAQFGRLPCPLQPRRAADHGRCSRQDPHETTSSFHHLVGMIVDFLSLILFCRLFAYSDPGIASLCCL